MCGFGGGCCVRLVGHFDGFVLCDVVGIGMEHIV